MASSLRWWFGGLVALLLAAGLVRLLLAENLADDLDQATVNIQTARDANSDVLQSLTDVETGVRGYQLTRDPAFLEPAVEGRRLYSAAIERGLAHAPDAHSRDLLRSERNRAEAWLLGVAVPIMTTAPSSLSASDAASDTGKRLFDELRRSNRAVSVALDESHQRGIEEVRQTIRSAAVIGFGLSVLTALASLLVGHRMSRALISPLQGLRRTLQQHGAGDRAARAREAGPPEMRQVIHSFNELCDESDRLRAAERRRLEMRTLAHQIGIRLRGSLERGAVLDEVVAALASALSADRVFVQLGEPPAIVAQWHQPELAPLPAIVAATAGAEPVAVASAVADDPVADATGAGAYVSSPFGFNDERFGAVILTSDTPREWLADELALIDTVCVDLGGAFQHVHLYEHERHLVDRLRELDQHKTDFIATVSHELRTPLTSVLGYLEVLTSGDQGPLSERQMKSLRVIERNAQRLGEMVADLLTLSRIESGTFTLELSPVQLLEAVQRATDVLVPLAGGVGLELQTDVPADLWTRADMPQLQRIIVNLVGNAIKFSDRGGAIRITAGAGEPSMVTITVADSGVGIPEHEQAAVFQPFQRGSNAVANATQGPGLGLAVVRSIVEQHHGRVELKSEPGRGTTVTVVLPRAAAPAGTTESTAPSGAQASAAPSGAAASPASAGPSGAPATAPPAASAGRTSGLPRGPGPAAVRR